MTEDPIVLINHPPAVPTPLNDFSMRLVVNGTIRADLGQGGFMAICWNPGNQELTQCDSSIRYKENVNNFGRGLELIERLRPVSFNWKQGGIADVGLIAEEVEKAEPLLATYDTKGVIQGVKYDRVAVVLLNAVKEQQAQIKQQSAQIQKQQQEIDGLKRLVYSRQSRSESRKAARRAGLPIQGRPANKRQVSINHMN